MDLLLLSIVGLKFRVIIVYCLFFLILNGLIFLLFFDEFFMFLEYYIVDFGGILLVGDFNIYVDICFF